jgi:hypothetical protein
MSPGIFLIQNDGQLVELSESPYDSESILQGLIAKYPSLLVGDQFDADRPRRWLLIKRELGIPGGENQGSRWSVDHLLLDQDAVPTIVEVKRSTDTRIRREVVGQMLDYAANAVAYWPAERLQLEFEATMSAANADPASAMIDFLGPDADANEFWLKAKTNLQAGRLRLVFVADEIPTELRRIIEFLNQQMDPVEVLGVEIRQFVGAGVTSLIPRVIGQTAEAERRKGTSTATRKWNEADFLETLGARSSVEADVARSILEWAKNRNLRLAWGGGTTDGSLFPMLDHPAGTQYTLAVRTGWNYGQIQLQLPRMTSPFQGERKLEFLSKLREKTGWEISGDAKYPGRPLTEFADPQKRSGLLEVLDWLIAETRAASKSG